MNKTQRREITEAFDAMDSDVERIATLETAEQREEYAKELEDLKETLEGIRDAEQEKFDNMPEGLQGSERGEAIENAVGELDGAITDLETAISAVRDDYPAKPDEDTVEAWATEIQASIETAQDQATGI